MNASSYLGCKHSLHPNPVRVGALGAVMAGFILAASPAHADRIEKHFPVQSKPKIMVRNSSGRIQVKAWTKNEVLVAWTNASGKSVVETEAAGNRVEVSTQTNEDGISADDSKTDFEITVPVESELSVRTDSGNVTVDSVHGDMTFDTVGANLQLSDVDGYMVVKTIDGSLLCTRCSGKLEANSISGNVQMIAPTLDSVRVQTSSGNILFDGSFLSRGIYIMKNFSGTIEVHFSSSDSFDVECKLAQRRRDQSGDVQAGYARNSSSRLQVGPRIRWHHERRAREGRALFL